jgi:hypothetical protein
VCVCVCVCVWFTILGWRGEVEILRGFGRKAELFSPFQSCLEEGVGTIPTHHHAVYQSHTRMLLLHLWEISPRLGKGRQGGSATKGEFLPLQHKEKQSALSHHCNSTLLTSSTLQHHGERHLLCHPWGARFPRLSTGFRSSRGGTSLRILPSM